MVSSCSFLNFPVSGLPIFGSTLKSLWVNFHVFKSHLIFYYTPRQIMLEVCLIAFMGFMVYQFFNIKTKIGSFIEKNRDKEVSHKEYQLYLLFFSITIIVIEIINEIFQIRPQSLLYVNLSIGGLILLFYFLTVRVEYLRNKIPLVFITIFLLFTCHIARNIIIHPNDIVPVIAFLLTFYFSYSVLRPIRIYWYFAGATFIFHIISLAFDFIPLKSSVILLTNSLVIFVINQVKYAMFLNTRDNFRFTNEIVHKGSSLTVASNKKGELIFCSESIIEILGYTPDEVIGMGFRNLTEDHDFIGDRCLDHYQDDVLYTRKLRCKNGDYKYIQWKDKRFSEDLFIGIGQDITEQIKLQDQYKNLIQTAADIIFEIDTEGNFTFINEFAFSVLDYTEKEVISKHYATFIHPAFRKKVAEFYKNLEEKEFNYDTIEFPILKKNGDAIWISQKVIIRKNDMGETIGFAGIARDITELKNNENEKRIRLEKIEAYTTSTKKISTTDFSHYESLHSVIDFIIEEAAVSKANRISFWKYYNDTIICKNLYSQDKSDVYYKDILDKASYPIYFETLQNKAVINASDVFSKLETSEFQEAYFIKNGIQSMLDVPIFFNGKLAGVVCFESTVKKREWDNEDINYARTIADVISLAISSQMRLKAERKLEFKSQLLSALALCTEKFLLSKTTEEMFKETYNIIGKAVHADHIYYYEKDFETNTISQKYKWSRAVTPDESIILQKFTEDNLKEITEKARNKKILNTLTRQLDDTFFKNLLLTHNIKSILILPLYVEDVFSGFIGFDDCHTEHKWSEEEIYIFQTLANNISSALERNRNQSKIIESEEKFKLITNNIPGTVYLSKFDAFSTKIFLNDQIFNLTGYSKAEFFETNLSFLSLIHPDDKEEVIESQFQNLKNGKALHNTYRIRRKTGEYIWIEEFGDVIKKGDEIEFVGGIYFDITNKKQTEDAIKAKQLAEAANKSKSDFLANMSHEIRTPLNGIIGFTDLLMKTNLEEIQQKYMTTINQSAHSLLEIINDILDFSKIEAGKLDLFIDLYDIHKIVGQVFDLIVYESNQKKLQLELHIAPDVPRYIRTDIVRLKQILINLLSNAVKFTHQGSITVNVVVIEKKEDDLYVIRFSVTDTGIGILKQNKKKIFKAFSQEDSSTTRKFGGTGLGLTISNQLLALMDSRLRVKSKIEKGSTFYFDLTLKTSDQNTSEKHKTEFNTFTNKAVPVPDTPNTNKFTFMIAEDNKVNMLLLKTIIKKLYSNAIIHECENGYEALKVFETITPDLIFMDIQMPLMNGYETSAAIRSTPEGKLIPIIAVTAGTEKEERNKCLASGMNDYIPKPIMKGSVEETLTKWLK
ncbi:PAS domain S-box protein [Flavobacterium fluviatile]|uniref:PAS domain S-box protein n=1 Tax=Flavobacterium fluviatile TaxID=1862387 RepID=UPI0013D268B2|nr:PAS domain S-box protein [Flavobacterium fluviatile]